MTELRILLPPDVVDDIVERVAALVLERVRAQSHGSPWLAGAKAAADYLGWPEQRVYKHVGELPHYRHGQRLMFRRDELDGWLARREV